MGVEQFINRTTGINFRTSEGLLVSDLKEAPATSCQRNSLVSQGRVTYFQTQKNKNHKRCLRLRTSFPQRPDTLNSSSYFLDETVGAKIRPDYSRFHPEELKTLKGFYRPVDMTVPHDEMVYVKEINPGKVPWRVFRPTPPNSTEWSKHPRRALMSNLFHSAVKSSRIPA